ncbi:MAG: ChbG/HpnK family deacetylase [Chloracidobacterium sp.]|nr:ChbG/HpnK family deacetylase [Chloracidobacterium sp.]
MNSSKKLIINADDYGLCSKVNLAVEQLARMGRLGGVSVLANGDVWEQAVNFLRDHSELSAGIHFNAVEGRPVSVANEVRVLTNKEGLFVGLRTLLRRWLLNPVEVSRVVEIEWRAQIERLMRTRVKLTHADSHCHLHAFPLAYPIAEKLCHEYGIAALRWPHERENAAFRRVSAIALTVSLHLTKTLAWRTGLRHNNNFLGFNRAGGYGVAELIDDLRMIPDGVTEIALHPSMVDGTPYPKYQGKREHLALLSDDLHCQIEQLGIELISWEKVK